MILCVALLSSSGLSGTNFNATGYEDRNNSTATENPEGNSRTQLQSESQTEPSDTPSQDNKKNAPENTGPAKVLSTKKVKVNHLPKADAGLDLKVNVGDRVVLNAGNSSDPDGDTFTYSWKQISPKKPRIQLNGVQTKIGTFTVPREGRFIFLLTVRDDKGGVGTDSVTVITDKASARNPIPNNPANSVNQVISDNQNVKKLSGSSKSTNKKNNDSSNSDLKNQTTEKIWIPKSGNVTVESKNKKINEEAQRQAKKIMNNPDAVTTLSRTAQNESKNDSNGSDRNQSINNNWEGKRVNSAISNNGTMQAELTSGVLSIADGTDGQYSSTFTLKDDPASSRVSCGFAPTHFCQDIATRTTTLGGSLIRKVNHDRYEGDTVFFVPYPDGAVWGKCHVVIEERDLTAGKLISTRSVERDYVVGLQGDVNEFHVRGSIQAIGKEDLVEDTIHLEGGENSQFHCGANSFVSPWQYTISRAPSGLVTVHGEIQSENAAGTKDFVIDQSDASNHRPIAVAEWTSPSKRPLVSSPITLDGSKSSDPDGDRITWDWRKMTPTDDIVKNTLTNAKSEMASFQLPSYVPAKFTSFTTPPQLLPVEFSLTVEDTHQLKSFPAELSISPECFPDDKAEGEHARDLFNKAINSRLKFLFPVARDNLIYFLSGKGDTEGLPLGVSGKGVPKSLPIDWLDASAEFQRAQLDLGRQIQNDIFQILAHMKPGEKKALDDKLYRKFIIVDKRPINADDFIAAVGDATAFAAPHLVITKGIGGRDKDTVSGTVELVLVDIYDFNLNTAFSIPFLGSTDNFEIHNAIKCLGARNFDQTTTYKKVLTDVRVPLFVGNLENCLLFKDNCRIVGTTN